MRLTVPFGEITNMIEAAQTCGLKKAASEEAASLVHYRTRKK
jgi:hypothetical protein